MAAVGAEVTGSWFLSSGGVSVFILLLLLSVFLTALCTKCGRRSFKLRDPETDRNPPALIRVVKLEDAVVPRENPMIDEMQSDEKGFKPGQEDSVEFPPWRSHLGAPQSNQDVNGCSPPDHIYHTVGGGGPPPPPPPTNQEPEEREVATATESSEAGKNSVYAQVSKKVRLATPTEVVRVEEEEEEPAPPLPSREAEMEG